jgi:hypothetical protein
MSSNGPIRSKLPSRPLAADFDPTARAAEPRSPEPRSSGGPEQRLPPSPYDRSLVPAAANWLRDLPPAVAPRETAAIFPRIVNRLSRYWDSPPMMDSIFDELLIDRRPGRKGFPAPVLAELRALATYYRSLHGLAQHKDGTENQGLSLDPGPDLDLDGDKLSPLALAWLAKLPPTVRPRLAPVRFPRVVNRLARFWDDPRGLAQVFDELFLDLRSGRSGFPAEVLAEFRSLQSYGKSEPPIDSGNPWSLVPDRGGRR